MSKTSNDIKNAWNAKNYDRITIVVPKGLKDKIQATAKEKGYNSMGDYIKRLIQNDSGLLVSPEKTKD